MSAATEVYEDEQQPTAALAIRDGARALTVIDQPTLTAANNALLEVKALRRKFDDEFNAGIAQAFQHHRYLVAQKRRWTDPLDEAERMLKPKIAGYLAEQDRIRLAAQRAAQLAKEAAAKEAEDAADVAHELIQQGELDEAEQVVAMQSAKIEQIIAAAPAVPDKPIAGGTHLVKRWTWDRERVNIALMADDLLGRTFLKVDEAKVTRYVQNMKWDAKIPGIHIYAEEDVASSRR